MNQKTTLLSIFLMVIAISFFACDALDVEKEFYLEHSFVVQGNNTNFNEPYVLDAAAESDIISDYADLIKTIEILETTYEVTYHNGPGTQQINSATLTVSDINGAGPVVIGSVANKNLSALLNVVEVLPVNQAGVDRAADLIKNAPHSLQLLLAGSANEAPLDFIVKFRFKVKMVANPL